MNEFFIYTDVESEFGERYWAGDFTKNGTPSTTVKLSGALSFPTPRLAYDHAGNESRFCRALLNFRVGRRPEPINLRSLIA